MLNVINYCCMCFSRSPSLSSQSSVWICTRCKSTIKCTPNKFENLCVICIVIHSLLHPLTIDLSTIDLSMFLRCGRQSMDHGIYNSRHIQKPKCIKCKNTTQLRNWTFETILSFSKTNNCHSCNWILFALSRAVSLPFRYFHPSHLFTFIYALFVE